MRLIRFERNGKTSVGAVRGGSFLDLDALLEASPQGEAIGRLGLRGSMRRFLDFCAAPGATAELERAMATAVAGGSGEALLHKASDCRLLAPIHDPGKIICLGLNYADHAAEQGLPTPEAPIIFAKFASCIIGPGETVSLPIRYTQKSDYEVELAVIMGRRAREVSEEQAPSYVAGYTIMNDVTARDFQFGDKQWVRGKSCDTFAPLGPHLVTADEVADPHRLHLEMRLNGQPMQDSNTAQMVFKVPYLIAYLSRCMTLEPGDIISTGTPPGVGVHRKPPVFLKAGDVMEASIESIGTLTNPVA